LAGGDLKLVAERQDPVARLRQAGLDRLGNVEEGQILDLVDDFHQGRVEHRLRNDLFGGDPPAVGKVNDQVARVEQGTGDRQHVTVGRHEDAGTVGADSLKAARAAELHHFAVD